MHKMRLRKQGLCLSAPSDSLQTLWQVMSYNNLFVFSPQVQVQKTIKRILFKSKSQNIKHVNFLCEKRIGKGKRGCRLGGLIFCALNIKISRQKNS